MWDILTCKNGNIYFWKKEKSNSYKTVSQFTKQPQKCKVFGPQKIQRLNCVIGCFNVKFVEIFVEKFTCKFVVHSNEIVGRKTWHLGMNPILEVCKLWDKVIGEPSTGV